MLEVVFIELIRSNLQPIYKKSIGHLALLMELVKRYYKKNDSLFAIYRVRGWILSGFAPVLLLLPMLLLYVSFKHLGVLTPIYFFLFVLLLIPWLIIPALFMFYNPNQNKNANIIACAWLGLMLVAAICWLIFIITW